MNHFAHFVNPALLYINHQFDVPGKFSEEELPVTSLNLLPYTKEEEIVMYLLTLPCLTSLMVSEECGTIWEPWIEPLSSFVSRYPKHQITENKNTINQKLRLQKIYSWIISLCDWTESHNLQSNTPH